MASTRFAYAFGPSAFWWEVTECMPCVCAGAQPAAFPLRRFGEVCVGAAPSAAVHAHREQGRFAERGAARRVGKVLQRQQD
eukprot:3534390-Pleurochrysis_carterae.AAC.1